MADHFGSERRTALGRLAVDFGPLTVFLGARGGKYPDSNQLVITGSDTRLAVDSSISSHLIGPEFDSADLALLSHVHEDHMAGLYRLPEVPLLVPEADLAAMQSVEGFAAACGFPAAIEAEVLESYRRDFAYAPRPDASGYGDGASWDLGGVRLRALHLPGHTAGHSALLWEREGIAFIGDIDLSGFGPYYGDRRSSLDDFRRSIARLHELPARIWITGHHKGIYRDRSRFLADLERYTGRIEAREARLLARLAEAPASMEELVAHRLLYPQGFEANWLETVERRSIALHLEALEAEGRIGCTKGYYHLR